MKRRQLAVNSALSFMLGEPQASKSSGQSVFRSPLLYTSAVLVLVILYVAAVVLARWQENRQIEKQATQMRAEKQSQQDRAALEQLGGKELAILMFYASPSVIRLGQTAQLCYGVSSAKSVTLEPQDGPVWPSPNRCVDVAPRKSTAYVLTISDGTGHTQTQSLTVKVQ